MPIDARKKQFILGNLIHMTLIYCEGVACHAAIMWSARSIRK